MNLYIDTLKNPYIIVIIILIVIVVGSISYLDDKANKQNKKSFLGHCKLIMICLLSALIMLFGYIFIEKYSLVQTGGGGSNVSVPKTSAKNALVFSENVMNGSPDF